jgi:Tfp pilus assembly protein PilV
MNTSQLSKKMHRMRSASGFTIIEIVMATLALGIAMTLTVQILGWVARERRSVDRRAFAVQEAANAMERLAARPWEKLTPAAARAYALSPAALESLPGAELSVTVTDEVQKPPLKRVGVQLSWRNRAGGREAPVRLTAWVSPRGRAKP